MKQEEDSKAFQAEEMFLRSQFEGCLELLQVSELSLDSTAEKGESNEFNMAHNKYLAKFGVDKDLDELIVKLEELILHSIPKDSSISLDQCIDDIFKNAPAPQIYFICLFNIASIYFQQKKKLGRASKILNGLYNSVKGGDDDAFTIKVCFLLAEVLLYAEACDQRVKNMESNAPEDVAVIEDLFGVLKCVEESQLLLMETLSPSEVSLEANSILGVRTIMKLITMFQVHIYKCRKYILQGNSKQAKKEIKTSLEIYQRDIRHYPEKSVTYAYMCLHNLSPLTPESFGTWNDMTERLNVLDKLNQMALYAKAFLEFQRDHYIKAMKLLTSCHPSAENLSNGNSQLMFQNNTLAYLNDMGALYIKAERYHAAVVFLRNAVSQIEAIKNRSSDVDDAHLSLFHQHQQSVFCNYGLALLHAGRPVEAYQCYQTSLNGTMQSRRSLILTNIRLGECCLQNNSRDATNSGGCCEPIMRYISEGPFRRIFLSTSGQHTTFSPDTSKECTLRSAVVHFSLGLTLLSREMIERGDSESQQRDDNIPSFSLLELQEYCSLCLAYSNLRLSNWACAESILKNLLASKLTNDHGRYLAQNYLAEALCALGRYDEAFDILDVQMTVPPPQAFTKTEMHCMGTSAWGVSGKGGELVRPELMAEVLRNTNRSIVLALLGKLSEAQTILRSILSECPSFSPAIRCLIYVLLRKNQHSEARKLLKFINASPQINTASSC